MLRQELTRRNLMKGAGAIVAAATEPVWSAKATASVPQNNGAASVLTDNAKNVTAQLSAYMAEAGNRALPDEVAEKAKQHILDTIAAMISGADLPPAKVALKFARASAANGLRPWSAPTCFAGRSKRRSPTA